MVKIRATIPIDIIPTHTHAVNIAGSFVLGALSVSSSLDPRLKLLAGTGMCGALTTFSTFSVDTVRCPILAWVVMVAVWTGPTHPLSTTHNTQQIGDPPT